MGESLHISGGGERPALDDCFFKSVLVFSSLFPGKFFLKAERTDVEADPFASRTNAGTVMPSPRFRCRRFCACFFMYKSCLPMSGQPPAITRNTSPRGPATMSS